MIQKITQTKLIKELSQAELLEGLKQAILKVAEIVGNTNFSEIMAVNLASDFAEVLRQKKYQNYHFGFVWNAWVRGSLYNAYDKETVTMVRANYLMRWLTKYLEGDENHPSEYQKQIQDEQKELKRLAQPEQAKPKPVTQRDLVEHLEAMKEIFKNNDLYFNIIFTDSTISLCWKALWAIGKVNVSKEDFEALKRLKIGQMKTRLKISNSWEERKENAETLLKLENEKEADSIAANEVRKDILLDYFRS